MDENYSVKLSKVIDEFDLESLYLPDLPENILITCTRVNRPGLQMVGFYDHYEQQRLQIIGKVENLFLAGLDVNERAARLEDFYKSAPAGVIYTTSLPIDDEVISLAEKYRVPLLRTTKSTSDFMAALIAFLNVELGPRITRHGVLVEVYGEGVLLLGDSGVGKSETAIELIKRGHRLIADDNVIIKEIANELYGTAPDIIRYFMELRGIGIINVKSMYGSGSVLDEKNIQLIIQLENWQQGKEYDRIGDEMSTAAYFGISVPKLTIPVSPGRNLAIIIEVAARNFRLKSMGYDASEELITRSIGR